MASNGRLLAGVELGGTKCVCILGRGPHDVIAMERIPTTTPEQTLQGIQDVFSSWRPAYGRPHALGIASFGPLDLRPESPTFGSILATSKVGWRNTDVARRLAHDLEAPIGLDTDVNAAALAEGRWGAARGLNDYAYVTVGTGIGVGNIVRGRSIFGSNHTEVGHIRVVRRPDDSFPGICPFHSDCIEGLASGPAIKSRAGVDPNLLPPDHPTWNYIVHGLAQLLHTVLLTTAPERVFLGGGVMNGQEHLFGRIREELRHSLNGYIDSLQLKSTLNGFILPPGLGAMAGPLGALALAADAADAADRSAANNKPSVYMT